jgi:uncharacterized repeat protein (TIGR02543 family)
MVALLVPLVPVYAADEIPATQSEASDITSAEGVDATTAEETEGPDAAGVDETNPVVLGSDDDMRSQEVGTFATLAEAEDAGAVAGVPDNPQAYVEGEILVVLAGEDSEKDEVEAVEESLSTLSVTDDTVETELLSPASDGTSTVLVELPDDVSVEEALLQAANDENIAFAQPNFYYTLFDDEDFTTDSGPESDPGGQSAFEPFFIPNDPEVANSSSPNYQWWLDMVNAFDAWDVQRVNRTVTVAVIDTGARLTHNDLKNNISPLAWDAYYGQSLQKSAEQGRIGNGGDSSGHGTHVAGIIAAEANNNILGAGVSYNARVLPIAVFPVSGLATTATVREAFIYIIAHRQEANIRVINMSFGGYDSEDDDPLFRQKIQEAKNLGILSVAAAGNDNTSSPSYPGDYPEVISVVAVNRDGSHWNYSATSGSDHNANKNIAAPGNGIYSTYHSSDNASRFSTGTSMATPIVSGIAALLFAKSPGLTPAQAQQIIENTATDLGTPGRDDYFGHGLVNARKALENVPSTVTFNANGGSVSPASITRSYNTAIGTLPTPTRAGHTFDGWYTAATGGTRITDSTKVTTNVTYWAHWIIRSYTVTFNSNGGSASPPGVTRTYDTAIGALPSPGTRTGYVFEGWYTATTGGTRVTESTRVMADTVCYAYWAQDFNGAVVAISTVLAPSRVLDIPGQSTAQNVSPILWDNGNRSNQRFKLTRDAQGYYTIQNVRSGLMLDLSGSRAVNGTTVVQWASHGGDNQKWRLVPNANGSYTIASKVNENYCLDLPGYASANNTEPALWTKGPDKTNQQFYLNVAARPLQNGVYTLASAASSSRLIDIQGASRSDGAAALLWSANSNNNQKFRFTYNVNTGYYSIVALHSGKSLDVTGPGATQGSAAIQWATHGGYNQQWYVAPAANGSYALYSAASGMALDIKGNTTTAGTPLIVWPYHGGANQRWVIRAG